MSIGESSIGEVAIGSTPGTVGVPIIPEVTRTTKTLVFLVEVDLIIQPQQAG